jgi:hypothetical protein
MKREHLTHVSSKQKHPAARSCGLAATYTLPKHTFQQDAGRHQRTLTSWQGLTTVLCAPQPTLEVVGSSHARSQQVGDVLVVLLARHLQHLQTTPLDITGAASLTCSPGVRACGRAAAAVPDSESCCCYTTY